MISDVAAEPDTTAVETETTHAIAANPFILSPVSCLLSERLSDADVQLAAWLQASGDHTAVQLEPEVDADRAERRLVPQAEPGAAAHVHEAEVGRVRVHVAAVHEHRRRQLAPDRHAEFRVHDDHCVAADGETVRADRVRLADGILGVAADRRIAAREKPLAGWYFTQRRRDHASIRVDDLGRARKSRRQPEAGAGREHDAAGSERVVPEALHERLRQPDLRSNRARGQSRAGPERRPAVRPGPRLGAG